MSYKPLENVTIVFSTANITVCADEWGDLYYTTEIPDEFVNQGEPYPRSKCKPIIDLPPEQFDRVLAIYKELPDDLLRRIPRIQHSVLQIFFTKHNADLPAAS